MEQSTSIKNTISIKRQQINDILEPNNNDRSKSFATTSNIQTNDVIKRGLSLAGTGLVSSGRTRYSFKATKSNKTRQSVNLHTRTIKSQAPEKTIENNKTEIPDKETVDRLFEKALDSGMYFWGSAHSTLQNVSTARKWQLIQKIRHNEQEHADQGDSKLSVQNDQVFLENLKYSLNDPSKRLRSLYQLEKRLRQKTFLASFVSGDYYVDLVDQIPTITIDIEYAYFSSFKTLMNNMEVRIKILNNPILIGFFIDSMINDISPIKIKLQTCQLLLLLTYLDSEKGYDVIWNSLEKKLELWMNDIKGIIENTDDILERINSNKSVIQFRHPEQVISDYLSSVLFLVNSIIEGYPSYNKKEFIIEQFRNMEIHKLFYKMENFESTTIKEQIQNYKIKEEGVRMRMNNEAPIFPTLSYGPVLESLVQKTQDTPLEQPFGDLVKSLSAMLDNRTYSESIKLYKALSSMLVYLLEKFQSDVDEDLSPNSLLHESLERLLDGLQSDDIARRAMNDLKEAQKSIAALTSELKQVRTEKRLDDNELLVKLHNNSELLSSKVSEIKTLKFRNKSLEELLKDSKFKQDKIATYERLQYKVKARPLSVFGNNKSDLKLQLGIKNNIRYSNSHIIRESKGVLSLSSFLEDDSMDNILNNQSYTGQFSNSTDLKSSAANTSIMGESMVGEVTDGQINGGNLLVTGSKTIKYSTDNFQYSENGSNDRYGYCIPGTSTTDKTRSMNSATNRDIINGSLSYLPSPDPVLDGTIQPVLTSGFSNSTDYYHSHHMRSIEEGNGVSVSGPYLTFEGQQSTILDVSETPRFGVMIPYGKNDTGSSLNLNEMPTNNLNINGLNIGGTGIGSDFSLGGSGTLNPGTRSSILTTSVLQEGIKLSSVAAAAAAAAPPPPPLPPQLSDKTEEQENEDPEPEPDTNVGSSISLAPPPPPPPLPTNLVKMDVTSRHSALKLKQIHWDNVDDVENTIWADQVSLGEIFSKLKKGGILNNVNDMFKIKDNKLKIKKDKKDENKPKKLSFLPRDLAQQFGINLHIFSNYSVDALVSKVLACDSEILRNIPVLEYFNKEDLNNIPRSISIKFDPFSSNYLTGAKPTKSPESLERSDQIYLELCYNLRSYWSVRSKVLLLMMTYEKDYYDLTYKLQKIDDAVRTLKNSTKLRDVLYIIYSIGNYMNKRGVRGIRLSSLTKLVFVKSSNDSNISFLHFIEKIIRFNYPDVYSFLDDLKLVDDISNLSFESLEAECSEFTRKIREAVHEVSKGKLSDPKLLHPQDEILSKIRYKTNKAKTKSGLLDAQFKLTDSDIDKIILFYGENPKDTESKRMFFKNIMDFVAVFKKCARENKEREEMDRIYEERKKLMEQNLRLKRDDSNGSSDDAEDDAVDVLLSQLRGVDSNSMKLRSKRRDSRVLSKVDSKASNNDELLERTHALMSDLQNI